MAPDIEVLLGWNRYREKISCRLKTIWNSHLLLSGQTGSGKTTLTAQLLLDVLPVEAPLIILDPRGDLFLANFTEALCAECGKPYRRVTAVEGLETLHFPVLDYAFKGVSKEVGLDRVLKWQGNLHGTDAYGRKWYTLAGRRLGQEALGPVKETPGHYEEFYRLLEPFAEKREHQGGLEFFYTVASLVGVSAINPPPKGRASRVLDLARAVRENELIYVFAPLKENEAAAPVICKLVFFAWCLEMYHQGKKGTAVLDEFGCLGGGSMKSILQQIRGVAGCVFITQTPRDLKEGHAYDLTQTVDTNTGIKIRTTVDIADYRDLITLSGKETVRQNTVSRSDRTAEWGGAAAHTEGVSERETKEFRLTEDELGEVSIDNRAALITCTASDDLLFIPRPTMFWMNWPTSEQEYLDLSERSLPLREPDPPEPEEREEEEEEAAKDAAWRRCEQELRTFLQGKEMNVN